RRIRGPNIKLGKIERERTPNSRSGAQLYFPAKQVGQLSTDRQPKTGASILSACARIGLLKGFEDDALLFQWNPDPCVGYFKGDHISYVAQYLMFRRPSAQRMREIQTDAPVFRKLEGVR